MKYKSSGKALVSYGCAGIYIALIFVSIPWVQSLQEFAFTYFDKELFAYFGLVVLAAVLIGSFIYVKRSYNKRVFGSWLCLFAVGAGYFYFTARLWRDPVELIHFFEYGFLSYLLYRALRHDIRDVTIYFSVSFIILFLGTIDEIIQWFVPNRVWNFRDIGLNFLAGGLFLKKYSPLTVPFLYEMRIHIFRRDRYEDRGQKAEDRRRKECLTVAYKENQILEEYFGETLSHTSYQWPKEKRNEIEKLLDGDVHYESPVSSNLFTRFSLKGLWAGIGLMGANIGFRKYCVQT